jgi:hypothetical protein
LCLRKMLEVMNNFNSSIVDTFYSWKGNVQFICSSL